MTEHVVPDVPDAPRGHAPPWIFGITNLPFGVAGGYSAVAMPFFLRQAGLSVETIATLGAVALLPAAYQLFWAPILDLWIRRRAWLVLMSVLGGVCLAASLLVSLPDHLKLYEGLMVLGQALCGLVASCNGALVSTTLPTALRDKAAGWVNAANLGASALGGGFVLTLAHWSMQAAAIGLALMIVLPSLAALIVPETEPAREPFGKHIKLMAKDVWRAVKSRQGWTGLLFCISPVGTVALLNLFSAIGADFHASDRVVEWFNGYGQGFITAGGALASGYLLSRIGRRPAYILSGVLTALCGIGMAMAGLTPTVFLLGGLAYLLVAGLAYTAFSAVVYEIVGTAGKTASTLYSVFPAVGNQAIAYTMFFDGKGPKWFGPKGVLWADAGLNLIGVAFLLTLLKLLPPPKPAPEDDVVPQH